MGKYVIWLLAGILVVTMGSLSGMAHSLGEAAPLPEPDSFGNLLRLHVVANSDTADDQAVKRQVRDAVLSLLTPTLQQARDANQARALVLARQEEVRRAAQQVLRQAGKTYDVRVEVGRFAFPTKVYGDTALPAGKYEALRVSLGEAQGQNWWCVLFPPLCLIDAAGGVAIAPAGTALPAGSLDPDALPEEFRDVAAWEAAGAAEPVPTLQVRYAFLDWLKRQPLTPGLRHWLEARGMILGQAAR